MSTKNSLLATTDKNLAVWLDEQAKRLKTLIGEGWKLVNACVQNAHEKGKILAAVKAKLEHATNGPNFRQWVEEETDIGYSTADLWINIYQYHNAVKARLKHSNPLELTFKEIRDEIKEIRKEEGTDKPGSGRPKKTKEEDTPSPHEDDDEEEDEGEEADADGEAEADGEPDAEAKGEAVIKTAEELNGKTSAPPPQHYKIVIFDSDQNRWPLYQAILPQPITDRMKKSVRASVRLADIISTMTKLGELLDKQQPSKVNITITL